MTVQRLGGRLYLLLGCFYRPVASAIVHLRSSQRILPLRSRMRHTRMYRSVVSATALVAAARLTLPLWRSLMSPPLTYWPLATALSLSYSPVPLSIPLLVSP